MKLKKNTRRVQKENNKNGWPERASHDLGTWVPRCYAGLGPSRARTGLLRLVNY